MCKPQKVLSQKTEIKDNFKNLSFFRWGGGAYFEQHLIITFITKMDYS